MPSAISPACLSYTSHTHARAHHTHTHTAHTNTQATAAAHSASLRPLCAPAILSSGTLAGSPPLARPDAPLPWAERPSKLQFPLPSCPACSTRCTACRLSACTAALSARCAALRAPMGLDDSDCHWSVQGLQWL